MYIYELLCVNYPHTVNTYLMLALFFIMLVESETIQRERYVHGRSIDILKKKRKFAIYKNILRSQNVIQNTQERLYIMFVDVNYSSIARL